ncbi:MAG: trypsin-like peptidase domain-containing protein [Chloroflexi bacterium]|nr:trypsin-like peptidase domain-containing protein [Chloroflexota bacterium]
MKTIFLVCSLFLALAACRAQPSDSPPVQRSVTISAGDRQTVLAAFQPTAMPTAVSDDLIAAADAEHLLLRNVYERVAPSVVNVEVTADIPNHPVIEGTTSSGSGFVYDLNGHVVTNAHVVEGAREVYVTFNDGYVVEAQIIGADLFSDLAVIKIDVTAERLHPVVVGDSNTVRVGDRAIAIGNPFGLASSMTVGIVSGLGRQLPSAELLSNSITPGFQNPSIIQVDTDINPGNSGGPLLNSRGEVIGVNTAIRTDSGIFEGVGFAVPSSTLRRVVPELIETGRVVYPWVGITSQPADLGLGVAALAEALNLPVTAGVLIETVSPDSPAAKAGLRGGSQLEPVRGIDVCTGGDIIVAINGTYIADMDELLAYLVANTRPGDTVDLLVVRGGETIEVPVTLEQRPTGGTAISTTCGES